MRVIQGRRSGLPAAVCDGPAAVRDRRLASGDLAATQAVGCAGRVACERILVARPGVGADAVGAVVALQMPVPMALQLVPLAAVFMGADKGLHCGMAAQVGAQIARAREQSATVCDPAGPGLVFGRAVLGCPALAASSVLPFIVLL